MFRCSSASLLSGKNATFSIKFNTQPGECVYVTGNSPELGEWDIERAKRMIWNCGNTWDVEIGFPDEARLQYKYFVKVGSDIKWEKIPNRDVLLQEDGATFDDKWDSLRGDVA